MSPRTSERITHFLDWIKSLKPTQHNNRPTLNFRTSENHQRVIGIQQTISLHWRWKCSTVMQHHYSCIPKERQVNSRQQNEKSKWGLFYIANSFCSSGSTFLHATDLLRVCPSSCTSHTVIQVAARRCSQGKLQYCHTARYKASSCYHAMGMLAELMP